MESMGGGAMGTPPARSTTVYWWVELSGFGARIAPE